MCRATKIKTLSSKEVKASILLTPNLLPLLFQAQNYSQSKSAAPAIYMFCNWRVYHCNHVCKSKCTSSISLSPLHQSTAARKLPSANLIPGQLRRQSRTCTRPSNYDMLTVFVYNVGIETATTAGSQRRIFSRIVRVQFMNFIARRRLGNAKLLYCRGALH